MNKIPMVWFGPPGEKSSDPMKSNWEGYDPGKDDDEEMDKTDPDVIAAIGFDPKKLNWDNHR
jgi:hypothetical protein